MKKILISFLVVLMLVICIPVSAERIGDVPKKTDHEKVTVNLFWASWCSHCHDFIKYFSDKYEDYKDYFEIVPYLVATDNGNNEENAKLFSEVGKKVGIPEDKLGFPLIVVGESYHKAGFGTDGAEIIEAALAEYQNEEYKDMVKETIEETKIKAESKTFEEACTIAGVQCGPGVTDYSPYILIGIFVLLVGGLSALVILGKKK